jgi:ubiquinone/menaquinone biosynthesis C-methylase UbiE
MHERRFNREIERLRDAERIERLEVERVVQLSLENKDTIQSVLDVGSGSGLFAEKYAERGLQVTGVDANPNMLPVARDYVPAATFQEEIAEKLPFKNGSFDLVFMGLLLHETDDPLAALAEAKRVATQRIAILEWPGEEQPFGPPPEHRLTSTRISLLAKQAGLKNMQEIRLKNLVLYRLDC